MKTDKLWILYAIMGLRREILLDSIVYNKVGEWETKGNRKYLAERIDNWLNQFNDTDREEMLSLLAHFDYYSKNKIHEQVKILYNAFRAICNSKDVVFSKTEKIVNASYSSIFFMEFWSKNNLYGYVADNLSSIIYEDDFPKNIVIVDDYIGSGNTIKNYLIDLLSNDFDVKNKNFYILALNVSKTGKNEIEKFAIERGMCLKIIYNKCSNKAYEPNNIFKETELQYHKNLYGDAYDNSVKNPNLDFKFGYDQIEALVSFYYNTPNNTLGIFWQDLFKFRALFSRHKKVKTTLNNMKIKAKQRSNINNSISVVKQVDDYKMDIFMVYCISKSDSFDIYEACIDFGLNEKQINEIITSMLKNKYLINENGKYKPTEKLKQNLLMSRVKSFSSLYKTMPDIEKIPQKDVSYIPKNFKKKFDGYKN